jgi:hypothetical protein
MRTARPLPPDDAAEPVPTLAEFVDRSGRVRIVSIDLKRTLRFGGASRGLHDRDALHPLRLPGYSVH